MTGKTLAFMQWPAADRAAWERLFVDERAVWGNGSWLRLVASDGR